MVAACGASETSETNMALKFRSTYSQFSYLDFVYLPGGTSETYRHRNFRFGKFELGGGVV